MVSESKHSQGARTDNLNLDFIQCFVESIVRGGDSLRNGCFCDANLPRVVGLGSAEKFAGLFELLQSALKAGAEIYHTTRARVDSRESIGCFVGSVSAIKLVLISANVELVGIHEAILLLVVVREIRLTFGVGWTSHIVFGKSWNNVIALIPLSARAFLVFVFAKD